MENGFALMGGDFIVDADLNVWMTECQSSPGLGQDTPAKRDVLDQILVSTVDILDEVSKSSLSDKSTHLQNTRSFELIYTDDFQFRYDGSSTRRRTTCSIKSK